MQSAEGLKIPQHGFGQFDVPEMPAYVQGYSKRGNSYMGQTTPVYQQTRWLNKRLRGGMGAYVNLAEDMTFLEGYRTKKGNHGVYEQTRWTPGRDWRGNYGISSLAETKNYAGIPTRGGMLRKGGPRRSDYIDRPGYWHEVVRPGIGTSRFPQNNNNYAGLYEYKRRTPVIMTDSDPLVLRGMIEHNPFHINSHSAKQAMELLQNEFGELPPDRYVPGYRNNYTEEDIQGQLKRNVTISGDW